MLYYEYTLVEGLLDFGRLIGPWDGEVKRQHLESRDWLNMRLELIQNEFRRRGCQPKSFPSRVMEAGVHAWNVTEPVVKAAWGIR